MIYMIKPKLEKAIKHIVLNCKNDYALNFLYDIPNILSKGGKFDELNKSIQVQLLYCHKNLEDCNEDSIEVLKQFININPLISGLNHNNLN